MLRHTSPTVDHILAHLCAKELYGDVTEWCEMRNDCVFVVTCPDCGTMYTLDEDEYEALVRISREEPRACGILPLA